MRDQFQDFIVDTAAERAIERLVADGWTRDEATEFVSDEGIGGRIGNDENE